MRRFALALAAAFALAACGSPPRAESDWEKRKLQGQPAEEEVALPAYPQPANLIEFRRPDAEGFRFFIDRTTLSVEKEGVVRYVFVARSSEGAQNVTYEALRCETAENRVIAVGQPDRTWVTARSGWRPISAPRHLTLYRDFFCPQGQAIASVADAVRALERGGR
ncbi:MAG TPA: CNP1-like family protein [Burkholderiales bacterium]|nr:CNP1-like family protein [Burkholderiales bacterium]